MRMLFTFILSITVLIQAFAISTPVVNAHSCHQKPIAKEIKKEKPSCCSLMQVEKRQSKKDSKKDCCKGNQLMSCCISFIAVIHKNEEVVFITAPSSKPIFGYLEHNTSCTSTILRPPIS